MAACIQLAESIDDAILKDIYISATLSALIQYFTFQENRPINLIAVNFCVYCYDVVDFRSAEQSADDGRRMSLGPIRH